MVLALQAMCGQEGRIQWLEQGLIARLQPLEITVAIESRSRLGGGTPCCGRLLRQLSFNEVAFAYWRPGRR